MFLLRAPISSHILRIHLKIIPIHPPRPRLLPPHPPPHQTARHLIQPFATKATIAKFQSFLF